MRLPLLEPEWFPGLPLPQARSRCGPDNKSTPPISPITAGSLLTALGLELQGQGSCLGGCGKIQRCRTCWARSWPQKGRRLRRLWWVYGYDWRKWGILCVCVCVCGVSAVALTWLLGAPSPARPHLLYWRSFYWRDLLLHQQRVRRRA